MNVQEADVIFFKRGEWPAVSVIVPLYNYERYICETLDCVDGQTLDELGLIVVDDCSTDGSANVVKGWLGGRANRFAAAMLVRNRKNAGLSITRNTGAGLTGSPFLFFLDADNHIYPRCLECLCRALSGSSAAFAYSILEEFGGQTGLMGTEVFQRERLKYGNYIDAMALVRRKSLEFYGGYHIIKYGWEDFDLWLRYCENDEYGLHVPEILGRYRVHQKSMLRTITSDENNYRELRKNMLGRHQWLEI